LQCVQGADGNLPQMRLLCARCGEGKGARYYRVACTMPRYKVMLARAAFAKCSRQMPHVQ
jgi:hypothetical protein